MSRKDTILIAVLINAGLLALLFATAIIYDTDKMLEQPEEQTDLIVSNEDSSSNVLTPSVPLKDEVDDALQSYASNPVLVDTSEEMIEPTYVPSIYKDEESEPVTSSSTSSLTDSSYVEIKVKKGDVLEKIAKANGTTVTAIKNANALQSERLNIGQVLKIPVKKESAVYPSLSKPIEKKQTETSSEVQYYTIKSGDNPWKIAKQYNIKYDDILRLNNLDEDKARNLKVGDRIRIK